MTWLGTNNGMKIDLLDPSMFMINIHDIGMGLNNVCRFNGQLKRHYSVLSHSMNVARMVDPEHRLVALLHDATEAYICDIPTPLKELLGTAYSDIENRLANVIGLRYGVDLINLPENVKHWDKLFAVSEHHQLQAVPADWQWDVNLPKDLEIRDYTILDFFHAVQVEVMKNVQRM